MVSLCLQGQEEGVGDVDLFTLTEDRMKLVPNVKWLHYLQVCHLSYLPSSLLQLQVHADVVEKFGTLDSDHGALIAAFPGLFLTLLLV